MQQQLFRADVLHPFKSNWRPPSEYPDLSEAKIIVVDVETYDPELKEKGPGSHRDGTFIAGIAVGTDDGYRGYFPIAHEIGSNFDREMTLDWAKEILGYDNQPKVGANLLYDLEMLDREGVPIAGDLWDIQYAEPLLDENKLSYSLDNLAKEYLQETKVYDELKRWETAAYKTTGANIARCPVGLVGPYAEGDVDLPLRIFEQQRKKLHEQDLWNLFKLESENMRMLLEMRKRGVLIDVKRTEELREAVLKLIKSYQDQLNKAAGTFVNVNAAESLVKLCNKLNIQYPTTAKGNPSFLKEWLAMMGEKVPEIQLVLLIRKFMKLVGTFLEGAMLEMHINGRIYGSFHPLRGEDGGTVSGRFSASLPNLQQIPMRDQTTLQFKGVNMTIGQAIRSCFIPEEGCDWVKDDYSQIEFRILTHYGTGESAETAREMYKKDPKTDFHTLCATLCGIPRTPAKNINFGLAYNMGEAKLAASLNRPIDEAKELFSQYHENLSFVKKLQDDVSNAAARRGYIKTILGRRARFMLWEARDWDAARDDGAMSYEKAINKYGKNRVRRAYTYKACNRLIQGSAADVMKAAMNKIQKSGVCDVLGVPHLTVHDELDWSIPRTKIGQEAHDEVLNIMENAVQFKVPLLCDSESGPSWGEVK